MNADLADQSLLLEAAGRLARQYGLDLAAIGPTVLGTALAEVADRLQLTPAALARELREPAAMAALFNALPVGLSWIDRDAAQLKSAADWARTTSRPLRVLSAPCARGEEVWSLAAALVDAGVSPAAVQILGIDAMPAAIAQAELGEYALAGLSGREEPRPWWLPEVNGRLVVHPRLRPMARFRVANLLDPAALVGLGPFDLIFSRNFLIYLTAEARERWCRTLAGLLGPEGRLYTAASEALGSWTTAFRALSGEVPGAHVHAAVISAVGRSASDAQAVSPAPDLQRPLRMPARAALVSAASTEPCVPAPAATDPRALADAGELVAAEALLAERLARAMPRAEDLVTAALIALARGRSAAAEDALRRALFLDHRHAEAAALLAALLDQRGDAGAATRLRTRVGERR